jgi:hypothetical protein
MRTHVTFQASFPKDSGSSEPAGRELAQSLASYLGAAGFSPGPPLPHEGYAYTFTCHRERQALAVVVALVDDGVLEWLVYAEPQSGAVTRLLQKARILSSKPSESPQLQELCAAIHTYLRGDEQFQSVRWYTTEGWDTNPDTGWTRSP